MTHLRRVSVGYYCGCMGIMRLATTVYTVLDLSKYHTEIIKGACGKQIVQYVHTQMTTTVIQNNKSATVPVKTAGKNQGKEN